MIFIYGRETMLCEVLTITRHRIAQRLNIPLELVYAKFARTEEGLMQPQIDLLNDESGAPRTFTDEQAVEVIKQSYAGARKLMMERLAGVKQRRFDKETVH